MFGTEGMRKDFLGEGRSTWGDVAENYDRNTGQCAGHFKSIYGRNQNDNWRRSGDSAARRGADRAEVRVQRSGVQLQTAMHLRREKNDPDEEYQKISSV